VEYVGRADVHRFFAAVRPHLATTARMVPTRSNGQPAWGQYVRDRVTGLLRLEGVVVAAFAGDRVRELTRFEAGVGAWFGLPRTLG
jgi:RNA polymerase sigma-70 factor (ECF subfamily)